MKVSGFTIIRDGVRLGYPFEQAIRSILPMVDELIVAVGDCSDDTRERIEALNFPATRIIDTVWDPAIRVGGQIMAQQTNIALDACTGDWCFYIQADEVIHEADCDTIRSSMQKHISNRSVEGLSFRYLHFMGDYKVRNPLIYRQQARIVRNGIGVRSVGDACGFGVGPQERKPKLARTGARVFHYGHVRPPAKMAQKAAQLEQFYDSNERYDIPDQNPDNPEAWGWDLSYCIPYRGTHPKLMEPIIASQDWEIDFRHKPWFRNAAWWERFSRKNFGTIYRLVEGDRRQANAAA